MRSAQWKYYRQVSRYYWPIPLDDPRTLPGKRVAQYTYTDPKLGRTAPLLPSFPLLYDLSLDPGESYNVAERRPETARRLDTLIRRWEADLVANPRGWK